MTPQEQELVERIKESLAVKKIENRTYAINTLIVCCCIVACIALMGSCEKRRYEIKDTTSLDSRIRPQAP